MTIIDRFLKEMDEIGHASVHTLRAYRSDLVQTFHPSLKMEKEWETELLQWAKRAQVSWAGMELATRQRKAASIKSFFRWLYQSQLISAPLNEKIEAPQVPRKIPHFLSIDEVVLLLRFVGAETRSDPLRLQYLVLLNLLYGGGLRISEACHLRWENIRLKSHELCVLGKGGKERWVIVPEMVSESIGRLPRVGSYIWGEQPLHERKGYSWIHKIGKAAGLQHPLHPHALRHSYATHLVTNGMNLRTLQELLGHSSLSSTEKYLHFSMDQLARTLEAHHPLSKKGLA